MILIENKNRLLFNNYPLRIEHDPLKIFFKFTSEGDKRKKDNKCKKIRDMKKMNKTKQNHCETRIVI